jgi:hypothetical protein
MCNYFNVENIFDSATPRELIDPAPKSSAGRRFGPRTYIQDIRFQGTP